jgi:hypothetical protein
MRERESEQRVRIGGRRLRNGPQSMASHALNSLATTIRKTKEDKRERESGQREYEKNCSITFERLGITLNKTNFESESKQSNDGIHCD